MNYTTSEVFEIVSQILGDYADGIFASYDKIDSGADDPLYSDSQLTRIINSNSIAKISSGITRIAIIPFGKDYVIKMPITGIYGNPCYGYGCDDIENCEILKYVNFEDFNIFDTEQAIYDSLFLESRKVFIPCFFIGKFNGIPVYIQEKVERLQADMQITLTNEESSIVKTLTSSKNYGDFVSHPLDDDFIMAMIKEYGIEAVGYILEDCKNLDDLHCNNYGYTKNGCPVIFDFAGYDGEMYEW